MQILFLVYTFKIVNQSFKAKYKKYPKDLIKNEYFTYIGLAISYLSLKNFKKALKNSICACQFDPSNARAYGYTALIYIEIKETEKALQFCQKMELMNLYLKDYELITKNYFKLGIFQKSYKYGKKCEQLKTQNRQIINIYKKSDYIQNYSNITQKQYLQRAFKEKKYQAFQKATQFQYSIRFDFQKAFIYLSKSDYIIRNNYKYLQPTQDLTLCYNRIITHLGITCFKLQDFVHLKTQQFAAQKLNLALNTNPNNFNAVAFLGSIFKVWNQPQRQRILYQNFDSRNQKNTQINYLFGQYYNHIKDYRVSIQSYQKHLNISKKFHSQAYLQIGNAYYRLGEQSQALKYFYKCLQKKLNNIFGYIGLALIYANDIYRQAVTNFIDKMNAIHLDNIQFIFILSIYYKIIQKYAQSAKHYWSVIQPFVKQFQVNAHLRNNSELMICQFVNYYRVLKQSGFPWHFFFIQQFFLFKLMKKEFNQQFNLRRLRLQNDNKYSRNQIITTNQDNNNIQQSSEILIIAQQLLKVQNIQLVLFQIYLAKDWHFQSKYVSQVYTQNNAYYFFVDNYQKTSQYHYEHRKKLYYFLLEQILKQNKTQGLQAYRYLRQQNLFEINYFERIIQKQLVQKFNQIKQACKIIERIITQQNFANKFYKQVKTYHSCEIVRNIGAMICMHTRPEYILSQIVVEQQEFQAIINQIMSTIQIPVSQYLSTPGKDLLLIIALNIENVKAKLLNIIKKHRTDKGKLKKQILYILRQLLSQQFIKYQLIKFSWKSVHDLIITYDESLQTPMHEIFKQFIQTPDYTYKRFGETIKSIIMKKSKFSSDLLHSRKYHKYEYPQPWQIYSAENSTMDLAFNCQIQQSSIIDSDLYSQYYTSSRIQQRTYKIKNMLKLSKIYIPFYYEKYIPLNLLKNKNQCLTSILFKNIHDIMRYLSQKDLGLKYVAKYFVRSKWCRQFVKKREFTFQMEKGDPTYHNCNQPFNQDFIRKRIEQLDIKIKKDNLKINSKLLDIEDIKIVHYLKEKGIKEIIKYLLCIAMGILQLEAKNIFHVDLQLRNVIKVGNSYKIIDFDWAFVYKIPENASHLISSCFENTLMIIKTILSFNLHEVHEIPSFINAVSIIFPNLSAQTISSIRNIQITKILDLKNLQRHAKQYHRIQFNRLLSLLSDQQMIGQGFNQLNKQLNKFLNNQINFKKFNKFVEKKFDFSLEELENE